MYVVCSVLAGVVTGVAAFAADFAPDPAGRILLAIASSGFSWGLVAFIVGYFAPARRVAATASVGALALAVITYYVLILLLSDRWRQPLGSSSVSKLDEFSPVMRAAAFWMLGALLGGLILGCLAQLARAGCPRNSGIAFGVAFGLLAGEAIYTIFYFAFVWVGPLDSFVWARLQPAVLQLLLAAAATSVALWFRRGTLFFPAAIAAGAISTTASVAIWHLVQTARVTL
ncbi:DUF6518 family protein [Micromonospora zamorensis]|uniref:DUF6518 family protein n=1 Tax=Micromonospora zamorensis TaxID=709883 RepID=UPI0033B88556